jgi:hypothetical protein
MIDPRRFEDFKKYFAEYGVIVKGELDAEYKRVAEMIAEWDKRTNHAEAVKQLARDQTDLYTARDAFEKMRAATEAKLGAWETELKKREAQLAATLEQHAADKRALTADKSTHETMASGIKAALAQREQEIADKEKSLQGYQGILHDRDLKLAEKEARVEKALSMLSSAVRG